MKYDRGPSHCRPHHAFLLFKSPALTATSHSLYHANTSSKTLKFPLSLTSIHPLPTPTPPHPPPPTKTNTPLPPRTTDPQATVKAHIKLLHNYNEIRDIGQGLMGIIADNRGVRVSEVYKDFDVGEGD